jgi:hypothetical protein
MKKKQKQEEPEEIDYIYFPKQKRKGTARTDEDGVVWLDAGDD